MDEKLKESDYAMVQYFYEEKGDIERWSEWENKKPLFKKYNPELIKAIKKVKKAEWKLSKVIDNLEPEGNYHE